MNKPIKKGKIHPERLSRYITSKECMNTVDKLVALYNSLTEEQRKDIKKLFEDNKSTGFIINNKYKN